MNFGLYQGLMIKNKYSTYTSVYQIFFKVQHIDAQNEQALLSNQNLGASRISDQSFYNCLTGANWLLFDY